MPIFVCLFMNIYTYIYVYITGLQHMNTCVFGTDEKGIIAWVFGADVKGIIWVLGRRNASQRREIRETYQQIYSESLIDRLQFELSGDFKVHVIALLPLLTLL